MAQAGSLAFAHDALLPRAPGGMGSGAALALLVHLGLIVALTTAVDWRTQAPTVVSAELWASVPQSAAPPPPAVPAPAPSPAAAAAATVPAPTAPPAPGRDPDIAIQRAERSRIEAAQRATEADKARQQQRARAEQARAEQLNAAKAAADQQAKDQAADAARLARQREQNLKRMMGQAGSAGSTNANANDRSGNAAQDAAPTAAYAGKVAARIRRELVFAGNVPESAEAEVLVRATASGTIIGRQLTKPSGYAAWDDAVLQAIDKTGSLPRDSDGRVPTEMTLVFKRRD